MSEKALDEMKYKNAFCFLVLPFKLFKLSKPYDFRLHEEEEGEE